MKDNKLLIIVAVVVIVGLLGLTFLIDGGSTTKKANINTDELSNDAATILANAQQESASVKESQKKEFNQIDVTQYLEYYDGSEQKLVLVARPTCQYCQIAEPILQNISYEYNIEINYLNTDEFTESDQASFLQSNELFTSGFGTPMLLIVHDSTIIDKVDGLTDYAHYVVFLQQYGYIS